MFSTKATIVTELAKVLPCYYEQVVDSSYELPLITYMEMNNRETSTSHEMGYSSVTYRIKLWADTVSDIETYSEQIDEKMRGLYFTRTNSSEMCIGSQLCRILDYRGLIFEKY